MNHIKFLKCMICGKTYQPDEVKYVCPDHGNEGILDVVYDYEVIASRLSCSYTFFWPGQIVRRYKERGVRVWRYVGY